MLVLHVIMASQVTIESEGWKVAGNIFSNSEKLSTAKGKA